MINLNLSHGIYANVTRPYSISYSKGFAPEFAPQNKSNCAAYYKKPSGPGNSTIILNTSTNGTITSNTLTNATVFGNSTAMQKKLSGSVGFYDLNLPLSIVVVLAILEVIGIALAFASNNEWVVIFSLAAANFMGLILMLGVAGLGAGFLLISAVSALYYIIKNAHKWWH